ncbi:hypothetical protein NL676_030487 [Syzygium grande]|nr:hypothetical protein NL676_030487 [Syzygium grande]
MSRRDTNAENNSTNGASTYSFIYPMPTGAGKVIPMMYSCALEAQALARSQGLHRSPHNKSHKCRNYTNIYVQASLDALFPSPLSSYASLFPSCSSSTPLSLALKVSPLGNPGWSVGPVLDSWVQRGNKVRLAELQRLIRDFRRCRRFSHALECDGPKDYLIFLQRLTNDDPDRAT